MINFGMTGPETIETVGINAKMNEFQAAMGLCVLDEMEGNLKARAAVWHRYEQALNQNLQLQAKSEELDYNYAYFPVVFRSEELAVRMAATLKENGVLARRYFYPSLESVACLGVKTDQPVSKDIASRILCLPIFDQLSQLDQQHIINLIAKGLKA